MAPGDFLRGVLADGARPFRHRAGVRELLGLPDDAGVTVSFGARLPAAAFTYLQSSDSGEPYGADEAPSSWLEAADDGWFDASRSASRPASPSTVPDMAVPSGRPSTVDSSVTIPGSTPRPAGDGARDGGADAGDGYGWPADRPVRDDDGPEPVDPGGPRAATAPVPYRSPATPVPETVHLPLPRPAGTGTSRPGTARTAGTTPPAPAPVPPPATMPAGGTRPAAWGAGSARGAGPAGGAGSTGGAGSAGGSGTGSAAGSASPAGATGTGAADTGPAGAAPTTTGGGAFTGAGPAAGRPPGAGARRAGADAVPAHHSDAPATDPVAAPAAQRRPAARSIPTTVPSGRPEAPDAGAPPSDRSPRRAAGPAWSGSGDSGDDTGTFDPPYRRTGEPRRSAPEQPAAPLQPPPAPQVVVVRQPAPKVVSTAAFWERRHIGRLRARILR